MKLPTGRWWYRVGLALLLAFVAIQLVPYGRHHVNPPTVSEPALEGEMPPAIYRLMHAHARLNVADRDRLARGLAKTVGVSHQEGTGGR